MNKTFKEGIESGAEQLAQSVRETLPKVQFNKNGYEIRTNVLDMAKSFTEFSYSNKWTFGKLNQTQIHGLTSFFFRPGGLPAPF